MNKIPLEYALEFARYNIPVFPLMTGQKKPYPGTKGFYDATTDIDQIKQWALKYPNCNWGMPTGSRSGITALDIDPRNGGEDSMETLIDENGKLPKTPTVETAGGGWHYYYRIPSISKIKNGKISDGVDIKTDGGYVVIPGSHNSETDAYYEWVEEHSLFELEVNEMPGWIITMLNKKNNFELDEDGFIGEGQRNIYLTSIAGTLRRRGAGSDAILACLLEVNKDRCNPPLPEHEIHTISESMMNYEPESEMIRKFMNGTEIDLDVFGDAIESQEVIIGYIMREDKAEELVVKIFGDIQADQLIDPEIGEMFTILHKMWMNGISLTPSNISTSMGDEGFDPADLIKMGYNIVHTSDVNFHVNRILNAWMLRRANTIFTFAAESTKNGRRSPKDIVGETIGDLMGVMERSEEKKVVSARDAVRGVRLWLDNADPANAPYTPYNLPWLDDMTDGAPHGELIIVAGRPSQGKGHPVNDMALTPEGRIRYSHLKVGDYVIGSDGKPTKILDIFKRGMVRVVDVTFSDGSTERVTFDHLWAVSDVSSRLYKGGELKVLETHEMMGKLKKNLKNKPSTWHEYEYKIPPSPEIEMEERVLPLDPYALGALLGDGSMITGSPIITCGDQEVVSHVLKALPEGMQINFIGDNGYRIVDKGRANNRLQDILKELKLWGSGSWDKFIPWEYMHGSIDQRVSLLQGLFDTDGYASKSGIEFTTASISMAHEVKEIVLSLGGHATINEKKVKGKVYQRMYISFPNKPKWSPFRLKRKRKAYKGYSRNYFGKSIVNITEAGIEECLCIKVEAEDSLYLTKNYNLTHNTALALKMASAMCQEEEAVVFFSAEMSEKQLMMRLISTHAQINSRYLKKPWTMGVDHRARANKSMSFIEDNYNLFIDPTTTPSPQYMMAKVLAINSRVKVKAVVFDFLELAGIDAQDEWAKVNKVLRLEQALIGLKILAKTLGIPVIILSQVGREAANRSSKNTPPVPRSSDLRWSGMIEQLANQILMVYYPWFFWNDGIPFATDPPVDYYEIHVVKNRDGEVGTIPLSFVKRYGDFVANDFTASGETLDLNNKLEKGEDLPWHTK